MKLLLHICCAPCVIYPLEELKNKSFSTITGFFYNPNIHPYAEYNNRKKSLEGYLKKYNIPVICCKYDIKNFFRHISGNEEFGARCQLCWRMRLEETALYGVQNKYDLFSTTLLVSPYQDQEAIKGIGQHLAKKYNIEFYYKDFRQGFSGAKDKAHSEGLYMQKYCGCLFSEKERFEKKSMANSTKKTTGYD